MNGRNYLIKKFLKWLLIVIIPIFFIAIFSISRSFYGPVLVEIRNGQKHSISIDSLEIKRCSSCEYEKLKEPKINLTSNQRGYVGFNARRGILSLRLVISQQNKDTSTLICEINVISTDCEATAYIHGQQMGCDACTYVN